MENIIWKAGNGQEIKVEVDLETEKEINLDGDKITVPCCDLHVRATLAGKLIGTGAPQRITPLMSGKQKIVAAIGKLAMNEENYNRVLDAIKNCFKTESWMNKERAARKAREDSIRYERETARIDAVMNM